MDKQQLKGARLKARLTQVQAAELLSLSQSYLSQLEKGERPITSELARLATKVYGLSAVALPLPSDETSTEAGNDARLARQLSGFG